MDTIRMKAILLLTAALAFVTAPFWSGGFNGFEPDQFPVPQEDPPAQPAGYAFSIWGVIYLWLAGHAVYGLVKRAEAAEWDRPRWPLIVSLTVGASWLAVAQTSPIWATILIWVMLVTALWAMFATPVRDMWLGRYPIELYTGWLTAASCVSLALTGAGYGIGPGAMGWAYIALAVAIFIAAAVVLRRPAPFYAVAVAWALVAVVVANLATAPVVAAIAGAGALLVVLLTVRNMRHTPVN